MAEFIGNSNKSKIPEKKNLTSVVKKGTVVTKPTETSKLIKVFFPDGFQATKDKLVKDILIPAIKGFAYDALTAILYPDGSHRPGNILGSRVNYAGISNGLRNLTAPSQQLARASGFDYDQILYASQQDADLVLTTLEDAIAQYNSVSVADLYDVSGQTVTNPQAYKYGWVNLSSATIQRNGQYFRIVMPRAVPLDG